MNSLIDRFIPQPEVRERHEAMVKAPAALVLEIARNYDLQSNSLVRMIFWLRAKVLRAKVPGAAPQGLVADCMRMGWGVLHDEPERLFIAGAACQPWQADVIFTPIPADQFASFAEPDCVKIVWTLEAIPEAPALTRFATETRVRATDLQSREKFRRYWRFFGIGIVLIRWLLLPGVRRQAEKQWRSGKKTAVSR